MEAFNAEPNVREQRLAAYEDRYVTVKPTAPLRGLRLEQGGELHHDDGSIVRLMPGDWVVENPDGRLTGISAAIFAESFKISGAHEDLRLTRVALGMEEPSKDDATPTPVAETPDPKDVREQVLQAMQDANDRVKLWADTAYEHKLIDREERDAFIATNEFPEGLSVNEVNGEWELTRARGHSISSADLRGDDEDGPAKVDWTEKTARDIGMELQKRGVTYKRSAPKGDLIALVQASDAQIADGGDGRLEADPNVIGPIVSVGAETPDTAARDPKLPDHGQHQEFDGEPDDGRRPGGETRDPERGEVQGEKEQQQKTLTENAQKSAEARKTPAKRKAPTSRKRAARPKGR